MLFIANRGKIAESGSIRLATRNHLRDGRLARDGYTLGAMRGPKMT